MTDNIIEFNGITTLPIPVDRILNRALEAELSTVLVIGWSADGSFYFCGSDPSGPENLWLLELAKKALIEVGDCEQ